MFQGLLPNQIMINKTVITTSTPVWMVPMIALPWLLLLIGILSVLVYIVIINGILIIILGTGLYSVELNLSLNL